MARTRHRNQKASGANEDDDISSMATKTFITKEGVRISELPLKTPEYGKKPTGRTLLDLIDEKRPRDAAGNPISASHKEGEAGEEDKEAEEMEEVFGHRANTFFFAVPLTILLFWLDVLVHMQYRQQTDFKLVIMRCIKAFPAIYAIHYVFHPRRMWVTVRMFLFGMSIAAGCYIVKAVNKHGYYFVMKKTPPLGTLWIWAVIEMGLMEAVLSLVAVYGYTYYAGYSII
ncbi:hypothetical protein FN846DRAFT_903259 [Sphaerosporella brunnea]|uniref:DUF7719 domain-containing protein n=1 Tax=Sphaerosporella brunnea TaxID=1250544 RepID=A0A5J5F7G9_9PEZI|nr:hypothetical protein FN846DRAFT_903259 [Sphaerosporella brunnea]